MDEKDWILLKLLGEEKSVTKAAERLFTSQPSLTYRIQKIEENFHVKLFTKRNRGIMLTAEGEYLSEYAVEMLRKLKETKDALANLGEEVQGTLRLAVSSNFAQYKLPGLLAKFSSVYPNVQYNVQTGWSTRVMKLLDEGDVHLGILRGNHRWQGVKEILTREQLYVISKQQISIGQLPLLPFIKYNTDTSLKTIIDGWIHEHLQHAPLTAMEVDRQETCKEMVKHGLGYSIVPEICLRESDQLYRIGLTNEKKEPLLRETWLMYDPKSLDLQVVKAFTGFLKQEQHVTI
ncbi:LysR family transcriptional regulator [Terribacillus saccharophilus]|uniref:LysR family transcriptional regulator n=1 Tax=Terribacillus saccharophilus TaxID=361277 RepID=A0A268HB06_9BACI|nr:LysR family transcriptional regulator [Terribacillus saccharophilus]PAE07039.1 LysR family transcriptional regulator [Terribacillus saccharophilus]